MNVLEILQCYWVGRILSVYKASNSAVLLASYEGAIKLTAKVEQVERVFYSDTPTYRLVLGQGLTVDLPI